jgi:hypothetical protein
MMCGVSYASSFMVIWLSAYRASTRIMAIHREIWVIATSYYRVF